MMDEKVLKELVYKAFEGRKGEFEVLKSHIEKFVMAVLGDAKQVVKELPGVDNALNLLIEIVDDKTNTGLVDMIDSNIARLIVSKVTSEKLHRWYMEEREKLLTSFDDLSV